MKDTENRDYDVAEAITKIRKLLEADPDSIKLTGNIEELWILTSHYLEELDHLRTINDRVMLLAPDDVFERLELVKTAMTAFMARLCLDAKERSSPTGRHDDSCLKTEVPNANPSTEE